ncbi:DUF3862 domain-containing protein [Brevibacillus laterosporus]|nr:DUF3862 domain-containing protein [Brevibacillus laterosporus]
MSGCGTEVSKTGSGAVVATEEKSTVKTDTKEVTKETSSKPEVAQSTSEPAPKVEPKKEENKSTISKAEFDEIKNGMSYEEVAKIIGSEGELLSEVGSKGEQFHTVVYMYTGEGDLGANANFTFQNNKLEMKAQMGLR